MLGFSSQNNCSRSTLWLQQSHCVALLGAAILNDGVDLDLDDGGTWKSFLIRLLILLPSEICVD